MAETDTGFMSCELKLDTNTTGWHKTMTKVLKNIKGVSYTIDAQAGIARVSGKIDPDTLMKLLAKSGKHAELLRVDSGYKEQFYTAKQAGALNYGGGHYHKGDYLYGRGYGYGGGYYNNSHYGHYPPSLAYPVPDPYHSGQYYDNYYEPHRHPSAPHVGFPQPPPPTVVHPFYDPDTQCTIM